MIKKESIDKLKDLLDIVEVVGSKVELKRSGANLMGLCPFHHEKTPSFVVSPTRNTYHCFGCQNGGNSITFIMESQKLDFVEAVEYLAQMYNFTLEYENNYTKQADTQILESLSSFYHDRLRKQEDAMAYLSKRHVDLASINKFQIGYCGPSFETINYIKSNNLDMPNAKAYGVVGVADGQREYARFNERIIFPIANTIGKIVGFGGRTLKENLAKYINSPQSKIFNKSGLLYGYHLAKESIHKNKLVIVCEGYLDVIMLHSAGFECAVATLGTALTQDHVPLLKKGEPKIIVSYDGDGPGISAALKAARMLGDFEGGVVIFDNGKDPADMVCDGLIDELREKFDSPIPFIDFVLDNIIKQFDINNPLQKEKATKQTISYLRTLSPLLQLEYKKRLASKLNIPERLISTDDIQKSPKQHAPYNKQVDAKLSESVLLKTIVSHYDWLDVAIEYLDPDIFQYRQQMYLDLLRSHEEATLKLGEILLDPTIKELESFDKFKKHLAYMLLAHYRALATQIANADIDINEKMNKISGIKEIIKKLENGELVAYGSISAF